MFSCEFCENTFFCWTPPIAASEFCYVNLNQAEANFLFYISEDLTIFLLALIPHPVTLAEHKEKERRRKNEQKGKERQKQEDKSQTIKKQNGILKGSKYYCLSHLRASKIQRFFLLVFLSPCFERYFACPGTNTVHILTPDFQPEVSNFVWTCTAVYYLYNYCLLLLVFPVFFFLFFQVTKFLKERNMSYCIKYKYCVV